MIKLKNICAGYGKKQILFDISASFQKGKVTSIIGPNGCGKSTLLKTAVGMLPIMSGNLTLDGSPVSEMKSKDIAKNAAYLAQSKTLPDMTVEQMVLHGRFPHLSYPRIYGKHDREIANDAIRRMGLSDVSAHRMASLSGGMRQNAYIAMALAQSSEYILMDEPTAYLDIANRLQLMNILRLLASDGKGVTAVLHDLTFALEFSDEIVVMKDGKIVMIGDPDKIFSSGVIKDVFGVCIGRCKTDVGSSYYYRH